MKETDCNCDTVFSFLLQVPASAGNCRHVEYMLAVQLRQAQEHCALKSFQKGVYMLKLKSSNSLI